MDEKNAAAIAACSVKRKKTEPKAFLNDDYADDDDGSNDIILNDEQLAEDLQGGRQDAAFVVERCIEKGKRCYARCNNLSFLITETQFRNLRKLQVFRKKRASELSERARSALGLVYNESKEEINESNLSEIIDSIAAKTAVPQNISVTALCGTLPQDKAQEKKKVRITDLT